MLRATLLSFLLAAGAAAQDAPATAPAVPPEAPQGEDVFNTVEEPPTLIGGIDALASRVAYPEEARREGAEGTVYVQFIVDEEGRVMQPVCMRSPSEALCGAGLDAVRGVRFTPGRDGGQAVKVRFTVPLAFTLRDAAPAPAEPAPEASGENEPEAPAIEPMSEAEAADREAGIFWRTEQAPVLVGGLENLQRRVRYPEKARRAGIEGRVFVQFIVSESGRVEDAQCVRSPAPLLCDAAIEAVASSVFTPGYVGGEPVRVRFTLPVVFRLL